MVKYSHQRSKLNSQVKKTLIGIKKFEWKYKNLILLFISIIIAYFILKYKPVVSLIYGQGYLNYLEAFILGMLFTYAITSVPATAALYNLGGMLNPFLIATIGAFGSVLSDYLIFRFVRDKLMNEIKLLSEEIDKITTPVSNIILSKDIRIRIWRKISHSKIWHIIVPIIAGFIIASPLPDEIGVALFGAVKYEPQKFILFSYSLNFIGILAITSLALI